MFIEKYKGKTIGIELNKNTPVEAWLGQRFDLNNDNDEDRIFYVILIECDSVGIWIDWTYEEKIAYDNKGNKSKKVFVEELKHNFLVKWDFINSVLVVENPENIIRIHGEQISSI